MLNAWQRLFRGDLKPQLDAGNRANAPAAPPVQAGSYEYIQQPMFGNQGIVAVPSIPPAFQDWKQYPVDGYGLSGVAGGGSNNNNDFVIPHPAVLYYDESTGLMVNLTAG